MKKTVVVYSSKYGHTKKYAKFISNALGCDMLNFNDVTEIDLTKYDLIIYGAPIYQDMILNIEKFVYNLDDFKENKIFIFADGMLPANENNISNVIENNFLDSDLEIINFYYLRGGFDYNKLKWEDKLHIDYDVSLAKYGDSTSKYSVMKRLYKRKFDFVKEDNLLKLLQDAREYLKD